MYYLDFHQLYKQTTKEQRTVVRRALNRDEVMTERLKRQHNMCFYCGTEIGMADHLDHLIPVYYGGTNRPVNLVAACKLCNMTKMTDQIEITNPWTIEGYLRLIVAYNKWEKKVKAASPIGKRRLLRYRPKKVHLYTAYRADLFKSIKVRYDVPRVQNAKNK